MKILRKISVSGVNGIRGGFKNIDKKTHVMWAYGVAHNFVEKISDSFGTSYGFTGEFRATNASGDEFVAPVAYFPEPVQGMLRSALDVTNSVEFAFNFFVVPDAKSPVGYIFEIEPLLETKASSAMADLEQRLLSIKTSKKKTVEALSHDEPEPEPEPEPELPKPEKKHK